LLFNVFKVHVVIFTNKSRVCQSVNS